MEIIAIGELKANFSAILRRVKNGEKIVILNGKKKEKVAVLIPYARLKPKKGRKLGPLKGKSGYRDQRGFPNQGGGVPFDQLIIIAGRSISLKNLDSGFHRNDGKDSIQD